ncbi:hypothetical protein C4G84_RS23340 [Vibrio parahaemolyticus O5:K30]|uniref:hypothetical protein n=1 Tax=Vibrio vulnificus TaxID=672 RepID=UPI003D9C7ED2|nr:hypothetical protein [Vibrio parahaemolyticus O5:K30]
MHNYDTVFNILLAQKDEETELFEKRKTAINIVLAMLDNKPRNSSERLDLLTEYLGSTESAIIASTMLQSQFNTFKNLGFISGKPDISESAKAKLIEMCADVFEITSLLGMTYQHEKNEFWDYVNHKLDISLGNIFLS